MLADVWTVFWREVRQNRAQFEDRRRLAIGVGVTAAFLLGLEIVFGIHEDLRRANPVLLIWIWCWLPLGSAVTMATDTIAGERERHTFETLLATRLPARAILIGKVLAISVLAWLAAAALALSVLLALNAVTIWSGTLVGYPPMVALIGSVVSFLLTVLGTLTALLLSMNAPTVRQANMRVIVVTSMLPVLLVVPVTLILVLVIVALAILAQMTDLTINSLSRPSDRTLGVLAGSAALIGLTFSIVVMFAVTSLRFTRARLMRTFAPDQHRPRETEANADHGATPFEVANAPFSRTPLSYRAVSADAGSIGGESRFVTILRDAGVVAWKEVVEARALAREWRGWLLLAGIVVLAMAFQMSAFVSWFWVQGEHFSLMFWLGMAAVLPILVAQRSADAVAGERERHTGEILFTTRLSEPGILLGKLAVVALLPWLLALAIPVVGLVAINMFYAARGPFWYPAEVVAAGTALTLGVALLFGSTGMLLSAGAPTVQHAARRISWFLMPVLIAPGLAFRGSIWGAAADQDRAALEEGMAGLIGSGDLMLMILAGAPLLFGINAALIALLWRRFARGKIAFD